MRCPRARPPPPPTAARVRRSGLWAHLNAILPPLLPSGRALLSFRHGIGDWERLEAAAGPGGLLGWADDSPLPHCRWGGVSCCSVSEDLADALGGRATQVAVCALKLGLQPLQAGQQAAGAAGRPATSTAKGGSPAAADLEPLRDLPWLVML